MNDEKTAVIRALNDAFRTTWHGNGQLLITSGVSALGEEATYKAILAVQAFDDFNPENDPHHEHDFGAFTINGHKLFWNPDYYDLNLEYGSPDPTDSAVTRRVLTIMRASEY